MFRIENCDTLNVLSLMEHRPNGTCRSSACSIGSQQNRRPGKGLGRQQKACRRVRKSQDNAAPFSLHLEYILYCSANLHPAVRDVNMLMHGQKYLKLKTAVLKQAQLEPYPGDTLQRTEGHRINHRILIGELSTDS